MFWSGAAAKLRNPGFSSSRNCSILYVSIIANIIQTRLQRVSKLDQSRAWRAIRLV